MVPSVRAYPLSPLLVQVSHAVWELRHHIQSEYTIAKAVRATNARGVLLDLKVTESARACSYYSVSTYCNSDFTLLAVQIWLYQCI